MAGEQVVQVGADGQPVVNQPAAGQGQPKPQAQQQQPKQQQPQGQQQQKQQQPATSQPKPQGAATTAATPRSLEDIIDDTAPIARTDVDRFIKPLRWIGAAMLIGLSAQSTVGLVADDVTPAAGERTVDLPGPLPVVALSQLIGYFVALLIFVLEIVLSERQKKAYRLVLGIDSWYTKRQIQPWIDAIFYTRIVTIPEGADQWHVVGAWVATRVIGWGLGIFIAYYGEILLLGRRRRPKRPK